MEITRLPHNAENGVSFCYEYNNIRLGARCARTRDITTAYEPASNVRRFTYEALGHVTHTQDCHHDVQYAYWGLGRLIRRA